MGRACYASGSPRARGGAGGLNLRRTLAGGPGPCARPASTVWPWAGPIPIPLPMPATLSWLLARWARGMAEAAVSPTSGAGPIWDPGARGTPLFCSTEAVALSCEQAWGCGGGGGCGPEGLPGGALESILLAKRASGQTHTEQPSPASNFWQGRLGRNRAAQHS